MLALAGRIQSMGLRPAAITLAILVGAYVLVFGPLVVQKSQILQNGDDFPQYLQALWTTAHGEPFRTTWRDVGGPGESLLGLHFELTLILLLPVYLLWDDPASLLLAQVVLVALAAFPVAATARRLLGRPVHGLLFGAAYLANPFVQRALFYDFHPESLQFVALTFAAAFLIQERYRAFAVAAALACLTKEDSYLYVLTLGVFVAVFGQGRSMRRSGFVTMGVSLAGLLATTHLLIPWIRGAPADTFAHRFPTLGNDLGEIITTVATRPAVVARLAWDPVNFETHGRVLLPLVFLPLLSLRSLLLIAPATALTSLTEMESIKTLGLLYPFSFLALHPFAAMYGLAALGAAWNRVDGAAVNTVGTCLVAAASCAAMVGLGPSRLKDPDSWQAYYLNRFPLADGFSWDYFADNEHARIGRRFLRTVVPPRVPLSTEYRLGAHVSNRRVLHAVADRAEEWVLFDLYGPHYSESPHLFRALLQSGEYGLVAFEDGFTLMRRGAPPGQLAAVRDLAERRVEAEALRRTTGRNAADRRVPSRFARTGRAGVDPDGLLLHRQRWALEPGRYSMNYVLRMGGTAGAPGGRIALLDVQDAGRRRRLARRALTRHDVTSFTDYHSIPVNFEIEETTTVEALLRFSSRTDLWIDRVELQPHRPDR